MPGVIISVNISAAKSCIEEGRRSGGGCAGPRPARGGMVEEGGMEKE